MAVHLKKEKNESINVSVTTYQEAFWRIPAGLSPSELRSIASGLMLDETGQPVNADRIKIRTIERKKKARKEKKKAREQKQKKNSNKFAALKELVKKKADAKKMKR